MSGRVQWSPKTASEVTFRYADFTDELASGESVLTTGFAGTVYSGNDPSPAIFTASTILPNYAGIAAIVQITLSNGVLGTIYQCVVTANTSSFRTLTKTASLAIVPPLN